ncbi:MAG: von Willebrand factor type A domain-containing protein [Planctomycetota bacterium]|nr:von Willebrand factor type A domain-containing protein [Planctomycetota bacterium]MDA1250934.1 von Willebrand factor type A domain-containing protein [Planctomycetota bacterium]
MTNPAFNPEDPRLTAFALGELDGADRTEIEQLIANSPEAAAAVKEIEETIGVLNSELAAEPAPELTEAQRSVILDGEAAAAGEVAAGEAEAEPASAGTVAKVASAAAMSGSINVDDVPRELSHSPSVRSFPWAITGSLVATAAVMLVVVSQLPDGELSDLTSATPSAVSHIHSDAPAEMAMMEDESSTPGSGFPDDVYDSKFEVEVARKSSAPHNFAADAAGGSGATNSRSLPTEQLTGPGNSARGLTGEPGRKVQDFSENAPDPASRRSVVPGEAAESGQKLVQTTKRLEMTLKPVAPSRVLVAAEKKSDTQIAGSQAIAATEAPAAEQPATTSPALPGAPADKPASAASRVARKSGAVAAPAGDSSRGGAGGGQQMGGRGLPESGPGKEDASTKSEPGEGKSQLQVASNSNSGRDEALNRFREQQRQIEESTGLAKHLPADRTPSPTNEAYEPIIENDFVEPDTREKRLSTFAIDVDTASYSNVRRFLNQGQVPPPNAVRIEELVNYFRYDYAEPKDGQPFAVDVELNACPWATSHRLARIGIKARDIDKTNRPPTSLVFMIDVSGSMRSANKLALVKQSIDLLVNELTEDDQVSIVAYANNAGLRLDATSGAKKQQIMTVVNGLTAGGSTNGEGGIRTAYETAIKHFIQGGSNRVIMCTDGDFNVGVNNDNELVQLIEEKAASGVFLSIFGFGMGNLKDAKLEKLADKGNGQYGYMDNLREAQKVFRDELMGTLYTVAKDVKIQVEFNPATVGAYRLIGYENRKLAAQDFNDDTKDAGEIGAGHVVTALYEIVPKKTWDARPDVGELRYDKAEEAKKKAASEKEEKLAFNDELLFVKLNYKNPDEETSTTNPGLNIPVTDLPSRGPAKAPSNDFMWAASVASFGMNLRGSKYSGSWTLVDVLETVEGAKGDDDLRAEFVELVKKAQSLIGPRPVLRRPEVPKTGLTPPADLSPAEARIKASVNNKYRRLLKKIEVANDLQSFGGFYDYGVWDGTSYAGHNDLPANGHWVYVAPHWYIWGEEVQPAAGETELPAGKTAKPAEGNGQ